MSGQVQNYQTEKDLSDITKKTDYSIVRCVGSLWQYDTLRLNRCVNVDNPNVEQYLKMFDRTHIHMIDILPVSRCELTLCDIHFNS